MKGIHIFLIVLGVICALASLGVGLYLIFRPQPEETPVEPEFPDRPPTDYVASTDTLSTGSETTVETPVTVTIETTVEESEPTVERPAEQIKIDIRERERKRQEKIKVRQESRASAREERMLARSESGPMMETFGVVPGYCPNEDKYFKYNVR